MTDLFQVFHVLECMRHDGKIRNMESLLVTLECLIVSEQEICN